MKGYKTLYVLSLPPTRVGGGNLEPKVFYQLL